MTIPDNRYGEVDVVRERVSTVQVEELLKGVGHRFTAAEHDLHHGAQTNSAIHGD